MIIKYSKAALKFLAKVDKSTVERIRETLIKSFVHIAPSDFLSDCTNKPQ